MSQSKINTNEADIDELLTRRFDHTHPDYQAIFPSHEEVKDKLKLGSELRVYLGIDPTGPNLHLGHTIPLLFLKQLLKLGHKPVLVIGDFTARIGDPSGKDVTRKLLSENEIKDNMKNYLGQVYKILPKGVFEVEYNSSWLSKMSLQDFIKLASHVTIQQMLQRSLFERNLWKWKCPNCKNISRSPVQFNTQEAYDTVTLKNNSIKCPHCGQLVTYEKGDVFIDAELRLIGLHEFLYPLMQGYDSVAMKIDGEVGGSDQTFNMLIGRDLEKKLLNKDKLVFATRLLVDAESGKKMSKTEGGLISLTDSAQDIYGKTMKTVPDEMIVSVFELCTEKPMQWINENKEKIKADPLNFKKQLAFELVRMYHGEKEAEKAQKYFTESFGLKSVRLKDVPSEMFQKFYVTGSQSTVQVLVDSGVSASKTEAKNLIEQRAITRNDKKVESWDDISSPGDVLKKGSHKFIKIEEKK